ncbi:MAG: hypothetical protein H5U00_10425 [Clostridia bacterium]|nr:hypothetical protein [Clostridia bacterium]
MARGVTYLLLTRPQFLLLTPACFVVGVATALLRSGPAALNSLHLLLALVGAVAAHIAVNVLNDYLVTPEKVLLATGLLFTCLVFTAQRYRFVFWVRVFCFILP